MSIFGQKKHVMTSPTSEEELSLAIRGASDPLSIRGGGTRVLPVAGEVLSTAGLSGVSLYEPGALTLVAGAGTPLAEVEAILAAEGQRLPFEPPDLRALLGTSGIPTIGGVVGANASGPRRIQAGAVRDSLIGVRFVDGAGQVIKNGGRVMKNVTGYDLVKLMAGSHGTLGVLSEVAFKVLPAPLCVSTLLIGGLTVGEAVAAMSAALASPYEVKGVAHAPSGPDGSPVTMIRVEGFEGSVMHRSAALKDHLGAFGKIGVETDPDTVRASWEWVRDVKGFANQPGDVWRISLKPSDAPGVALRLNARAIMLDWGGGLIWALTEPGTDARAALGAASGHATLIRADESTLDAIPRFHPEPAPLGALAADLRRKFDPRGILNPGLMG